MQTYYIRVKRSQRDEVLEEYPNLTADIHIPVKNFETRANIEKFSDKELEELIEKKLKDGMKTSEKYEWSRKEEVTLVDGTPHEEKEDTDPIYKGKVKIPKEYRGKNPQRPPA